jgi:hypothetical protein
MMLSLDVPGSEALMARIVASEMAILHYPICGVAASVEVCALVIAHFENINVGRGWSARWATWKTLDSGQH